MHNTEQYANNRIECDHGRLKGTASTDARPQDRPNGQGRDRRGHAFVQNIRRGHYTFDGDTRSPHLRVAAAFDSLAATI